MLRLLKSSRGFFLSYLKIKRLPYIQIGSEVVVKEYPDRREYAVWKEVIMNKKERINIRVTTRDKKSLESHALKNNMKLSEYILDCCKKKKTVPINPSDNIRKAVELQEALNYIKEKYGDDDYLQKVVDRLWKL